jgi:hypothetical protein
MRETPGREIRILWYVNEIEEERQDENIHNGNIPATSGFLIGGFGSRGQPAEYRSTRIRLLS